ncbi:flavodoxin family protein [Parafrankia elaeagni]|uniref:flavodoxin family protein n=1 Tax=Parafrankia elaeagni TaxID=222534 RepID=UPI0007C71CD7|nr:flavodoxin family protein [Parafrankia elaeagni]
MRFTFISGSERAGGNTDMVVDYAAEVVHRLGGETDIISLREFRINPCSPCGDCNIRTTPCAIEDDVPNLLDRMVQADALVYAAPVHGFGLSHLMQIFLERAGVGYLRFDRPLANKLAGVVVTGRRYSHSDVHAQIMNNLLLNRTILVGSGYPVTFTGGAPGDALRDQEGLDALCSMIDRMAEFAQLLGTPSAGGRKALPAPAERNERETSRLRHLVPPTSNLIARAPEANGANVATAQE